MQEHLRNSSVFGFMCREFTNSIHSACLLVNISHFNDMGLTICLLMNGLITGSPHYAMKEFFQ